MKAYEIFCQDVMGDELSRVSTDRRTYYNNLRQTLRTELAAGADCELLTYFAGRLQDGSPQYMYLLDAAALWECYEAAVEGLRFPRDIGNGVPFPLSSGGRLTWTEVQRQSELRTLPVAVLDEELLARIRGLTIYAQTPVAERGKVAVPAVNPRARLNTADARVAGAIPAPGKVATANDAQTEQLQQQLADSQQRAARLQAQCEALQDEVARLEARPRQDCGEMVQLADLILNGRMADAAKMARSLGGTLDESLQRLQEVQQSVRQLQQQLSETQGQIQADEAQREALRAQQQAAEKRLAEARQECQEAREATLAAQQARQTAEKSLAAARVELHEENARLRDAQSQLTRVEGAARLTRMQADHIS